MDNSNDNHSKIDKVGKILVRLGKEAVNMLANYAISYSNKSDAKIDALEKKHTFTPTQKQSVSKIRSQNKQRRNKAEKVKKIYK